MSIASLTQAANQMGQAAKLFRMLGHIGVESAHVQHAIDNTQACSNLAFFLMQGCPTVSKVDTESEQMCEIIFNEKTFFASRFGFEIFNQNIEDYVELKTRKCRSATLLQMSTITDDQEYHYSVFGLEGSVKYTETLTRVVDLGQIAEMIEAQRTLSKTGRLSFEEKNLFPLKSKDGELCVAQLQWGIPFKDWKFSITKYKKNERISKGTHIFTN